MRPLPLAGLLALALAFPACSRKAPVAPAEPAALAVLAVQPPARSAGYAYDGQIWALFDRSLEPKTVDTTSVFLKRDTQRVPCAVGYEPTSRRIVVVPRVALSLNATYTVVVTDRVRGRDGAALAADYFWQFSTTSIRRVDYLAPSATVPATAVAMLRWSSPDALPGQLWYDVYAGDDSVAVHNRLVPVRTGGLNAFWLPRQYWPAGERVYWAVTTTNLSTGERLLSPVTSFTVLSDGAPTHEVSTPAVDWGAIQSGRPTQYCSQSYVPVGIGYNSAVRFSPAAAQMGTRVKRARLVMHASANAHLIPGVQIWSCNAQWAACGMIYAGPPFRDTDAPLGTASVGATSNELVFDSPGLAAWVEGILRGGDFSGLVFTLASATQLNLNTRGSNYPTPTLTVTVYD